jgi:hypothetical protein
MYLFAPGKPVKGKMLHIIRFGACEDELRHPLPDTGRELEAVPADRKVLPQVDFLACTWLVCYSTMFFRFPTLPGL